MARRSSRKEEIKQKEKKEQRRGKTRSRSGRRSGRMMENKSRRKKEGSGRWQDGRRRKRRGPVKFSRIACHSPSDITSSLLTHSLTLPSPPAPPPLVLQLQEHRTTEECSDVHTFLTHSLLRWARPSTSRSPLYCTVHYRYSFIFFHWSALVSPLLFVFPSFRDLQLMDKGVSWHFPRIWRLLVALE